MRLRGGVVLLLLAALPRLAAAQEPGAIDSGDTTWLLVSSALVMLMR